MDPIEVTDPREGRDRGIVVETAGSLVRVGRRITSRRGKKTTSWARVSPRGARRLSVALQFAADEISTNDGRGTASGAGAADGSGSGAGNVD